MKNGIKKLLFSEDKAQLDALLWISSIFFEFVLSLSGDEGNLKYDSYSLLDQFITSQFEEIILKC